MLHQRVVILSKVPFAPSTNKISDGGRLSANSNLAVAEREFELNGKSSNFMQLSEIFLWFI